MNLWKSLWLKMNVLARATLQDLFGEDSTPGPGGTQNGNMPLNGMLPLNGGTPFGIENYKAGLEEFQQRLDELQPGLALLGTRAKRMESEQRQAVSALEALDQSIDAAIRDGQDEQARLLLAQRMRLQSQADDLARKREEVDGMAQQMKTDVVELRLRLKEARQQIEELTAREQSAASLERMARVRREMDRDLIHLRDEAAHRDARAAQIEDRVAAMQDLAQKKR